MELKRRDLLEGTGSMPGCLSCVVARDPSDRDALWITGARDSRAIAGFDNRHGTVSVGGAGLVRR